MKQIYLASVFLLAMFVLITCDQKESKISWADIKGTWYLDQWTTYHTLTFEDSAVFVDNNIDTVFTLNYAITNNSLMTWTSDRDEIDTNRIIKLTKETLTLEGIHGVKGKRVYSRSKRTFDK